jgi:hypothetical protein
VGRRKSDGVAFQVVVNDRGLLMSALSYTQKSKATLKLFKRKLSKREREDRTE